MTTKWCSIITLLQLTAVVYAGSYDVKPFWMQQGGARMTGKQELESLSHHPRVPKETKTWWNDTTTEKRKMILQGLAADKTIKANFGSRSRLLEDHDKILQGEGAITLPTRRRFVDIREEIKDVRKDLIPKDHRQTQAVDAALEACFADAAVFVADPNEAYSCSCNPIDGGAYRLDCEATCGEYCNEEGLICGNKSLRRDYNGNGVSNFLRDTFEYTRGFVGRVDISQLNCFEDDQGNIECPECIAVTNGGACNSCFMQSCSTGEKSPLLDCENIVDGGAIFDLCAEDIVVDDGLFEFLSSGEYEDCIDPTVKAKEACETFRAFYETMYDDKQYECICQENSIGSMTLGCEAKCGKYCDATGDVCGIEIKDFIFDLSGSPYLVADNFFYTNGRDDRLTVIQRGCEQADNGDIDDILCSDCEVRINSFQTCTFCSLQTCDNGAQAPLIHCENIENGGAIFNLCETDSIKADGGVFDYFSSDEFQSCVDNSPANDICNEGVPLVLDGSSVFGSTELAINDNVPPCELASEGSGVWYRVEGTGKGILASTCSDNNFEFDSQLSIYSGSCEDLTCVAFNDDTPREDCPFGHHSSVAWFGEEGVVYHIKVHGYSLSRGEFEFYVKEVDWAIESCASKKASGEFSGFDETSTVSCNCAVAFEDSQELSCMSTCVYCHSEGEVCATQSSGGIYDPNEPFHTSYVEYKYTEGRNEVIRMNDFGCDSSGCTTCRVAVDGKRCNSCQNVDCTDQFGNIIGRGRKVDCSNVEPNAVFDECENPLTIESGIFEVLSSNEFTQCKQDPLDACQGLATAFEESGADLGTICSCEADGQDAILSCSEPDCHYCNTETSVCASLDYGGRISGDLGEITTTFNEYKYFEGRSESLRYEAADGRCVFTIDGTACSSCEQVICSTSLGAYQGVTVDCENIEEGASYNACTQDKVDSGVLELLSHQEFDACLDAEGNAESVCLERKVLEENKGEELGLGTTCECVSKAITGDHTLTCTDSSCIFCNYESLVCATNIFGVHYGRFGQEVSTFDGFQYTEGGRNEEVVLTNADGQCRVTVDDSECTSCESIVCIDEGTGNPFPGVDVKCENVPDGGNLSGCDRIFVDTGVLEVATDSEFSVCIKPRSSVESCILEIDDYKASLSADEDPICECTENEHGGHSMTCVEKGCLYCNSEKSVCGYNVVGKHFGRLGQVMGSFNGFQYIEGREDTVIFAQVQDPSDSRDCVVSAGDKECASCSLVSCGIFTGISVECENIEEGGSFNTCGESLVDSGVLEYFSFREFLECIQVRDPIEYCEQQKDFYELINPDAGTVCTCEAMGDEAKLSCADTGCQYCNLDESACNVKVAYGANISRLGYFQSTFDVRHYVVGRTERVVLHQTPSSACRVMVDDQECETCEIEVCGDGSQSYVIGCENVDDKYRLSGCSDFGNGIFAHLKATDGFGICVAYDGTFPPTSTPTIAPTSVSEDPDTTGGETGDGSSEGRQNQFTSWWFYTSILLQVVVLTS